MVDDLEITKRTQAALLLPVQQGIANSPATTAHAVSIADAVQLSDSAKNYVKQMLEGQTVAEAWLANKTALRDIGPARQVQSASESGSTDGESADQQSLKNAYDFMMADIAWLFDAMGTGKADQSVIGELVAGQAATDGVGVRPPVAQVVAQASQSGGVAALFVENLTVTIHSDKVVSATVDRVALTTLHETMRTRFVGADRPLIIDVGGQLQEVGTANIPITPKARPEHPSDIRDLATERGARPDDPRHALLIVREGGRLHPEGTLRIKLDALLPIK